MGVHMKKHAFGSCDRVCLYLVTCILRDAQRCYDTLIGQGLNQVCVLQSRLQGAWPGLVVRKCRSNGLASAASWDFLLVNTQIHSSS